MTTSYPALGHNRSKTSVIMKLRTWPILALAFGTLVVLIALSGLSALSRARRIFTEISSLHARYQ